MKNYQWSCCRVIDGKLTKIDLKTPIIQASGRDEALALLKDFFTENDCRPYREVT